MRTKIVAHQLAHRLTRLECAAGVMGLQQDIGQRQEARVQCGFTLEHIKRGRSKPARFKRIEQQGLGIVLDRGRKAADLIRG